MKWLSFRTIENVEKIPDFFHGFLKSHQADTLWSVKHLQNQVSDPNLIIDAAFI